MFYVFNNASSQNCLDTTSYNGTGTYFTSNGVGACGDSTKTDSMLIAAFNYDMYDSSKTCGSCLEINGSLGSVIVTIKDLCSSCPAQNIDLSKFAYSKIGNLINGTMSISWKSVPCPISGGIIYNFDSYSNLYYISLKIKNIRYAVKKVEFKNNGSDYIEMQRQTYNSFVISPTNSPATSPFDIRVTDILGNVIEEQVPFNVEVDIQSNFQFPLCQTTSVNDLKKTNNVINVYPNPTSNKLFIENGCVQFKLYDLTGKLVLQENNCKQVDLRDIQSGIYFYNIITNNATNSNKLIINKF